MATIPQFTQLGLDEPQPQFGTSRFKTVRYQAATGAETLPSQAAENFGQTVQNVAFQQQDELDTTRAEDAWNAYKTTAMNLATGPDGFANLKAGAAVNGNIYSNYTGQLEQARNAIADTLGDQNVQQKFNARANVTDLQFKDALMRHYTVERGAYEKQTFDGSMAAATSMIGTDPLNQGTFDTSVLNVTRRAMALAQHQGVTDPDELAKIKGKVTDGLISHRIDSLLYVNPVQADQVFRQSEDQISDPGTRLLLQHKVREASLGILASNTADSIMSAVRSTPLPQTAAPAPAKPIAPGFDNAVNSLLTREGGYVASDGNSGAPANYGINQAANPDIDVKSLTRDQAKNIYKTRYWDAIGGDNLPPATAMVALDTAALQGVGVAKKLITDTGGDPQAMIDARRGQLLSIANSDPAQAKNLPVWMSRLDGLQQQVAPLPPNTSGLPNSRDVRAQLPVMLAKVNERADQLYGPDVNNPDRVAFVDRTTNELRGKINLEASQLDGIQRQSQGALIDFVSGFNGGPPITAMSQIQSNPAMYRNWQLSDPAARLGIQHLVDSNARNDAGNADLYWNVFNRIHADQSDPNKIDFYQQILPYAGPGKLNMSQINSLRNEIDRNETPGGQSVGQLMRSSAQRVDQYFKTNTMFTAQPDRQIAATMKWTQDTGRQVDAYIKAGHPEKVRAMFQTDTPESVISPKYLGTYITSTPAAGLAAAANKARQQDVSNFLRPGETLTTLDPKTADTQWANLAPGAPYRDPQGNLRRKAGGVPGAGSAAAGGPITQGGL